MAAERPRQRFGWRLCTAAASTLLLAPAMSEPPSPMQSVNVFVGSDKGGNTVDVHSQNFSANLHSTWDTQIIESEGINLDKCLKVYETFTPQEVDTIKKIQVLRWMYQSRSYLDTVYDFKNGYLDQAYINRAKLIIEKQLVIGGLRLAAILTEVFKTGYKGPLSYNYKNEGEMALVMVGKGLGV